MIRRRKKKHTPIQPEPSPGHLTVEIQAYRSLCRSRIRRGRPQPSLEEFRALSVHRFDFNQEGNQ